MKNAHVLLTISAFLLIAAGATAQQPAARPQGMTGMGPGMMGMAQDSATMAEMGPIHELIINHDRIQRTVTNLPDGIRTVTESDDPQVALAIKEHVKSMNQRIIAQSDPGLPVESPAAHLILRNGDKVQTTVETTAKGVIVIQTSTDPATVAALQQHAEEVNDLVGGGMAAMRAAMMKNRGGMMQHGMNGARMGGIPPSMPSQDQTLPGHDQMQGMAPQQMQQMMTQHQEMGKLIDQLTKDFAALENEKDPVLLKKKLAAERALLKQLQSKFQQNSEMMGHMTEHSMLMQHGEKTMGFSQTETTHHFFLTKDGGVIQVEANDSKDAQNRDLIRTHLAHISHAFAAGDFSDPLAVHDKVPDGVPVMQRLKGDIRYTFEMTPQGGRVLIKTANSQALDAIHQFLRFQIKEHQTGDRLELN